MLQALLCTCLLLGASSTQTDWTGGPSVPGPVGDFGFAFDSSDSVVYAASGMILPTTQMSQQGVITDWIEHVVEDGAGNDGHNALRPADIDGDGDFDLAGASKGLNAIRLYSNNLIGGPGDTVSFTDTVDLSVKVEGRCGFYLGDINNDGRPDIVVPGKDSINWFRNDGNWNFTKFYIGDPDDGTYCEAGDVDNDGDIDIVSGYKVLWLWRNDGNMTFARESIAVGKRWRMALADLNNDDYLDLLQTDMVFLNPGPSNPGVFPHVPDWNAGFGDGDVDGLSIADFNGDNRRDLLMCRQHGPDPSLEGFFWFENDGTGYGYTQHAIATGAEANDYTDAAIAGDQDLDGRPDVVGGHQRVGYYHQYPIGTFTLAVVDDDFNGCHWVEVENLGYQPGGTKFTKDIMASANNMFHWWENGLDTTFSQNGWLVSSVLDAGEPSAWQWFVWNANRPAGTELDFFVRTGATVPECTTGTWQGPFSVATGTEVDSVDISGHTAMGDRYFQYRVELGGSVVPNIAPVVFEVRVVYDSPPDIHDVGATAILAPAGFVTPGTVVTPRVEVHNYGSYAETFPVSFRVGDGYDETVTDVTLDPWATTTVSFPDWTAGAEGIYPTIAFTDLPGDADPSNDTVTGQVMVALVQHDVGATAILEPTGNRGLDTVVTPHVVIHNYGVSVETFPVTLRIGGSYDETAGPVTLLSGQTDTVDFPDWTALSLGTHSTVAFTGLVGDENPGNDTVTGQVVVMPPAHDVGAVGIVVPTLKVMYNQEVWPVVRVHNFGTFLETFDVELLIRDEYLVVAFQEEEGVVALEPGESREVAFSTSWTPDRVCDHVAYVTTKLTGDAVPSNDEYGPERFIVMDEPPGPPGWTEVESMPSGPSGRPVKRGAWLALDPATRVIYATRGNKTYDFYSFDAWGNTWTRLADVEPGAPNPKPPDKGSKGVCDGSGFLYMTKGYNTLQFWKYDIPRDTWLTLPDVPEGPNRKKVKGGTDMVYLVKDDTGYVYLMKGYKTEFYRFNTGTESWDTLPNLPYADKDKWDKGSFLVYDGENTIYAHQSKYYNRATLYHYMYRYDVAADTWERTSVRGMPLMGLHGGRIRKKKAKDGSAGAWFNGEIFALKGGNTQQFFKYTAAADSWTELDTVPTLGTTGRRRRVKHGADLVSYGCGVFYALKGNKTREMWRYKTGISVGPEPRRGAAVMAGRTGCVPTGMSVVPNPLTGRFATVRYSLPNAGPAELVVCDVVGRVVGRRTVLADRVGVVNLDLRDLARGVYLVRLENPGVSVTRQLVIY